MSTDEMQQFVNSLSMSEVERLAVFLEEKRTGKSSWALPTRRLF